jgi:hypothetical protein
MESMMALGGAKDTAPEARDYVLDQLALLADDLKARKDGDPLTDTFYRQSAREIAHYLTNPEANAPKAIEPVWGQGSALPLPVAAGPSLVKEAPT